MIGVRVGKRIAPSAYPMTTPITLAEPAPLTLNVFNVALSLSQSAFLVVSHLLSRSGSLSHSCSLTSFSFVALVKPKITDLASYSYIVIVVWILLQVSVAVLLVISNVKSNFLSSDPLLLLSLLCTHISDVMQ
jgi:hypothetical protein